MRTYKTLAELKEAYDCGKIIAPLHIDHNNDAEVWIPLDPDWIDVSEIFSIDPCDLLLQALDLLGIPHEHG